MLQDGCQWQSGRHAFSSSKREAYLSSGGWKSFPSFLLVHFITPWPMAVCVCSVASDSLLLQGCSPQAPLSMKFSRQEYWSGLPFPPPGDFPNLGKSAHDFYIGRQILYHWATWEALALARQMSCHLFILARISPCFMSGAGTGDSYSRDPKEYS